MRAIVRELLSAPPDPGCQHCHGTGCMFLESPQPGVTVVSACVCLRRAVRRAELWFWLGFVAATGLGVILLSLLRSFP